MAVAPARVRNLISQVPGNGGVCVGWLADNGPSDPTNTGKMQYTFGLAIDALLDKMWWGISARFPGIGTPTALPLLSRDRGILQGINESNAAFATRLASWRDSWLRAGAARSLLGQIIGYLGNIRARTVDDVSNWCTYVPGDDPALFGPSTYQPPVHNWNWDNEGDPHAEGVTSMWWRFWLVVYSTSTSGSSWAGTGGTWGDGRLWGDAGTSWGLSVPASVSATLRTIVRPWKRAGSWCRWIVVALNDTVCDPFGAEDGTNNPNGGWGPWAVVVGGTYVPARPSTMRYCDGVATHGIPIGFPYY